MWGRPLITHSDELCIFGHGAVWTRSPQLVQMKNILQIQISSTAANLFCCFSTSLHAAWLLMQPKLMDSTFFFQHYQLISHCDIPLHVLVQKRFLHAASDVYLMWPSPVVCLCIIASDPCQCFLDRLHVRVLSLQLTQKYLHCFTPSARHFQQPCCGSYSTQHVLFITGCHELSEAAMTNAAFLFMKWSCWPQT